jgi:hypothetical protein
MTTEPHDSRIGDADDQSHGSASEGDQTGAHALGGMRREGSRAENAQSKSIARIDAPKEPPFELVLAPKASSSGRRPAYYIGASIATGLTIGYFFGLNADVKGAPEGGAHTEQASITRALPWKSEVSTNAGDKHGVARLVHETRSLRAQIEQLRRSADNLRAAERLRSLEAAREESVAATKTAPAISAKLEKLETRLAQLERVKIDRTPTGSLPKNRAVAKPSEEKRAETKIPNQSQKSAAFQKPILDYVLRNVYRGTAIVERRDGLIEEVARGDELPGAGRVTAIERHGGGWVVTTTQGVINQRLY